MNIQWVLADNLVLDPTIDIARMKRSGAFWGSWRTWRAYNTDNVICHEMMDADQLVKRQFQKSCNLYMPNSVYTSLGRPQGVKLYEGDFMGHEVDNKDELVAINLAATVADVVLLIGFNLAERETNPDKLQEHKARNYYGLIKQAIKSNEETQWIVVDHNDPLSKEFADLPNLDKDTFDNVLTILNA